MVDFCVRIFILLIAERKELEYDLQKETFVEDWSPNRRCCSPWRTVEDGGYQIPEVGEHIVSGVCRHYCDFHFGVCVLSQESSS